jgi:acetyl-CoA C-acetyltransferase
MRRVAIVGVGETKFGEEWERGFRDLIIEAGTRALEDADMKGNELEALYCGSMTPGMFVSQEHVGALIADYMGLNPIPAVRVEGACASGGIALREGYIAVGSGAYDIVAVGGVEKMTDVPTSFATNALGGAGDQEWELFMGMTFPGLYALMARRHMMEYGTTEEQIASVAVKNHLNGSKNKYAQFQNKITLEDVMKSKPIASPLKLLDCSPITDGAAVVVLASLDKAKMYTDTPIEIVGSAQASDSIALHDRENLTTLKATEIASRNAYKMARVTPADIKVAEVHDCFTIAEILAIEDLGFFKKGEGGKATMEGRTELNAEVSINPSGGLKACGHPVGATGVKQAVEIAWQLRGEAGERQVKGAEVGLTHNIGGSGATCVVHVLRRVD